MSSTETAPSLVLLTAAAAGPIAVLLITVCQYRNMWWGVKERPQTVWILFIRKISNLSMKVIILPNGSVPGPIRYILYKLFGVNIVGNIRSAYLMRLSENADLSTVLASLPATCKIKTFQNPSPYFEGPQRPGALLTSSHNVRLLLDCPPLNSRPSSAS